ncbi:MAG: DUF2341 domain-containing protein [Candidatus Micrarchaeia archaeon]
MKNLKKYGLIILIIVLIIDWIAGALFFLSITKHTTSTTSTSITSISSTPTSINLTTWKYRRPITIDNTQNSNTLSNYQVLVTLDTASLISAGKLRSDCGDIRFTDSDAQTLLSYWIGSGCNTASTQIWVKVPSIPASSTKTIYVYYGNPSATSASNAAQVFEWNQVLPAFTYNNPYGNTQFQEYPERTEGVNDSSYGRFGFGDNWAAQGPYWSAWTWDLGNIKSGYKCMFWWRGTHGFYSKSYPPSGAWKWQISADGSTYTNLIRITFNPSGSYDTGYRIDEVACNNFRYIRAIVDNEGNVGSITYTADFYVDAIRLRAYTSPEPTTSVGAEQSI